VGENGENSGTIHQPFMAKQNCYSVKRKYYTNFSLSGVYLHRVELNETYGEVSDKTCLTLLLFKVVRRKVSLPPLFFKRALLFRFKDASRKPEGISVERDTSASDSRKQS
jgi:hypothetical protein